MSMLCGKYYNFNTTYNGNVDVPPYSGILFEVTSLAKPLNVLTLELDIRFDLANDEEKGDLSIQVYTTTGGFINLLDNPESWDLVADTQLLLSPSGNGGIIDVQDFSPVHIEARQRQSFYVSMNQALLDHNVDALQKTGELAIQNSDMNVYVGAGTTLPGNSSTFQADFGGKDDSNRKFPVQLDPILNPMFAGVIHYRAEAECGQDLLTTTYIDIPFLLKKSVDDWQYVTEALNMAVENLMSSRDELKDYVTMYSLRKLDAGQTNALPVKSIQCPKAWGSDCPSSYLLTRFELSHTESLSHELLLYQFYQSTSLFAEAVSQKITNTESLYIGFASMETSFRLVLKGIPGNSSMDTIQQEYLAEALKKFLTLIVEKIGSIYVVQINNHELKNVRHQLRSQRNLQEDTSGSLVVTGVVMGAHSVSVKPFALQEAMQLGFDKGGSVFASTMTQGALYPGEISEGNRAVFFESLISVDCKFTLKSELLNGVDEAINDLDSTSSAPISMIVIGVAACLFTLLSLFLYRRFKFHKRLAMEVDTYREQMRTERRERRLVRNLTMSEHSVDFIQVVQSTDSVCSTIPSLSSQVDPVIDDITPKCPSRILPSRSKSTDAISELVLPNDKRELIRSISESKCIPLTCGNRQNFPTTFLRTNKSEKECVQMVEKECASIAEKDCVLMTEKECAPMTEKVCTPTAFSSIKQYPAITTTTQSGTDHVVNHRLKVQDNIGRRTPSVGVRRTFSADDCLSISNACKSPTTPMSILSGSRRVENHRHSKEIDDSTPRTRPSCQSNAPPPQRFVRRSKSDDGPVSLSRSIGILSPATTPRRCRQTQSKTITACLHTPTTTAPLVKHYQATDKHVLPSVRSAPFIPVTSPQIPHHMSRGDIANLKSCPISVPFPNQSAQDVKLAHGTSFICNEDTSKHKQSSALQLPMETFTAKASKAA